jgi:gliding motility-associated-like protein
MKRTLLLLLSLFLAIPGVQAQQCYGENLVPNPSLDEYNVCPDNVFQIDRAIPWTQPLKHSASSVVNQCMFDGQSTYLDTSRYKTVHWRSEGMAHLIVWDETNWRTYIEVPLIDTLIKNECYYAEFWVLTQKVSYKVIDALGLYFSDTLLKINNDTVFGTDTFEFIKPIYLTPQIQNPSGRIINDTSKWMKISGTFIAKGTETAMIMGNFKHNNQIQWEILNNSPMQCSRYYFDDFLVCKCQDTIPPGSGPPKIYIPNIFSPNGDGNNDLFFVRGTGITSMDLKIYNRWGNLVYSTNDQQSGWDGRFQQVECPEGAYFYVLTYSDQRGASLTKSGNVTLLR